MSSVRTYGLPPFSVVLVHGGPGAAGDLAPLARILSKDGRSILEPLQTKDTIEGQISELADCIALHAHQPVILIGHSWGAWLSCMVANRFPTLMRKVILVGGGPFEDSYAQQIHQTRMSRLSQQDHDEVMHIISQFQNSPDDIPPDTFARFGAILSKADTYDPFQVTHREDDTEFNPEIFKRVWPEADKMRKSGELLTLTSQIQCPVIAIHGDYDPHPAAGVFEPLERVLDDFQFILLEKCGHYPWLERQACEQFIREMSEMLKE